MGGASAKTPSVLLLGDRITRQYLERVKENLDDAADICFVKFPDERVPDIEQIERKIGAMNRSWDIIGYNYGHDAIVHGLPVAEYVSIVGRLSEMLLRLRPGNLIWTSTVPFDHGTRHDEHVAEFNRSVLPAIRGYRARVVDLYECVKSRERTHDLTDMIKPDDNELTGVGRDILGDKVSEYIDMLLSSGSGAPRYMAVLGDSIVSGYSVPLRSELRGQYAVIRGQTGFGSDNRWHDIVEQSIAQREAELGIEFALIQFNWGLHALKHVSADGKVCSVDDGTQAVPLERYGEELESLTGELEKTGARLIWASTTPVHPGCLWAKPDDVPAYNAVAQRIMQNHRIPINDLYSLVLNGLDPSEQPDKVHFTPEASGKIARQIGEVVREHDGRTQNGAQDL